MEPEAGSRRSKRVPACPRGCGPRQGGGLPREGERALEAPAGCVLLVSSVSSGGRTEGRKEEGRRYGRRETDELAAPATVASDSTLRRRWANRAGRQRPSCTAGGVPACLPALERSPRLSASPTDRLLHVPPRGADKPASQQATTPIDLLSVALMLEFVLRSHYCRVGDSPKYTFSLQIRYVQLRLLTVSFSNLHLASPRVIVHIAWQCRLAGPSKTSLVPLSSLFLILSTPPQEPALPPPFCIVFAAPLGRPTAARSSNVELRTSLKQLNSDLVVVLRSYL
jgi:hypothetical protein